MWFTSDDGVWFNKRKQKLIKYPPGKKCVRYIVPNGVTGVSKYAFVGSLGLESIQLPNSMQIIDYEVFAEFPDVKTIYYIGTQTQWDEIAVNDDRVAPWVEENIVFLPHIQTTVSEDSKTFTVKVNSANVGDVIIFATYSGGKFVEMKTAVYNSEDIVFTAEQEFTDAKVLVWDSVFGAKPVCKEEKVILN